VSRSGLGLLDLDVSDCRLQPLAFAQVEAVQGGQLFVWPDYQAPTMLPAYGGTGLDPKVRTEPWHLTKSAVDTALNILGPVVKNVPGASPGVWPSTLKLRWP
jgi:hypothetical protein